MIDRRELLEKARERNLTLGMIEKDYVLGWLLFGISEINDLTFKGGTALSKIYFPRIWRLSDPYALNVRDTWQGDGSLPGRDFGGPVGGCLNKRVNKKYFITIAWHHVSSAYFRQKGDAYQFQGNPQGR